MLTKDNYTDIPTLRPPGVNKKEIRDKGKLIIQLTWIFLQVIPAIVYSFYVWIFPGNGKSLKGKVALVTGAGRGLGRGLALELARQGCKVACVDINFSGAEETAKLIKDEKGIAFAYRTNVAKSEEIKEMSRNVTNDLGTVTYLVNNASLIISHRINEEVEDDVSKGVIYVNLLSYFLVIRAFLPGMKAQKDGHIVSIASVASFVGSAYCTSYVAGKWGVRGLMESLRDELRKNNENYIHLTCVHPYFINTSKDYVENWSIRFPELSVEEVAKKTIEGIKYEQFSVTVPECYLILHILKLLPQYIQDQFLNVIYAKVNIVKREKWHDFPQFYIAKQSAINN